MLVVVPVVALVAMANVFLALVSTNKLITIAVSRPAGVVEVTLAAQQPS